VSSGSQHRRVDTIDPTIDVDELMREIERYLVVVEAFRAEGCSVGLGGGCERSKDER
jgi:hypothetical protein